MSDLDTSNQLAQPLFEEPLLPLVRPVEVVELQRIYATFFEQCGYFDATARNPLFEAARFRDHLIVQLQQEQDWTKVARSLAEAMVRFRPAYQAADQHPLLSWHGVLLDNWPVPAAGTVPHAGILSTADRTLLEHLMTRIRRALPALRVGAAVGRLERNLSGRLTALGTSVLLLGDRLLAPAALFGEGREPGQVQLGYCYPRQIGNAPTLPILHSITVARPHPDIALATVVNAPAQQRGLTAERIAWEAPRLPMPVAIWYYPPSDGPAVCALGHLKHEVFDRGQPMILHSFGTLGSRALGAPIFDANWHLVAIYCDQDVAVAINQLRNLYPEPPPPEERPPPPPHLLDEERRQNELMTIGFDKVRALRKRLLVTQQVAEKIQLRAEINDVINDMKPIRDELKQIQEQLRPYR